MTVGVCHVCGLESNAATNEVQLTDTAGASEISICGECWDYIRIPRCRICGEQIISGRHGSIDAFDPVDSNPVCAECRDGVLFDNTEYPL